MNRYHDDPDETRGRAIARAEANLAARVSVLLGTMHKRVSLVPVPEEEKDEEFPG